MMASDREAPLVEMRGIVKNFGEVRALDGAGLKIFPGEILGLLGENGAGKTTLMRVLFGLCRPEAGRIFLEGRETFFLSPLQALRRGIGMVHQHFALAESHTILENIVLGDKGSARFGLIDYSGSAARIRQLGRRWGLEADPGAKVGSLSVGEKQRVEILKALYRRVRLLILDEPTAVLAPGEVDSLFRTLKSLAASGLAVIFISHKLKEVMEITARCVVLRRGRVAGELRTAGTGPEELAALMLGEESPGAPAPRAREFSGELLRVSGLRVRNDLGVEAVRGVDLRVRAGEIFGIAGVSGNGQRELAESLAGIRPAAGGRIELGGREITGLSPGARAAAGMARIPEDRCADGVIGDFSVAENLALDKAELPEFSRGIFLRPGRIRRRGRELMARFDIRAPGPETPVRALSGGNIQKVLLARELGSGARVILAAQPTRGLDPRAARRVRSIFREAAEAGGGVLLISEDLDELIGLCDTLAVIYAGKLTGPFRAAAASRELLGRLMLGAGPRRGA